MATEQAERPLTLTMISSYFHCTNLDPFTFSGPQRCLSFQSQLTHLPQNISRHDPWTRHKNCSSRFPKLFQPMSSQNKETKAILTLHQTQWSLNEKIPR